MFTPTIGGRQTLRGTPGREPDIPYQIPNIPYQIWKVCPFKRNMLTAEGQHFICPLNMGCIPYWRVILAFRGLFLPEKRVLQDMICCPSAVNIFLLKGHAIPYLVRNVWYLVRNMWLPSRCTSHSPSVPLE